MVLCYWVRGKPGVKTSNPLLYGCGEENDSPTTVPYELVLCYWVKGKPGVGSSNPWVYKSHKIIWYGPSKATVQKVMTNY